MLSERKALPADYAKRLAVKRKRGHDEAEFDVVGAAGSDFRIIMRRSQFNPLDFSVVLVHRNPRSNQCFRLRRYNGRSHEHTNPLEGQTFYGFHIHTATQRYQDTGNREDTYAEVTDRYSDMKGALTCLLTDCGFDVPSPRQGELFGPENPS